METVAPKSQNGQIRMDEQSCLVRTCEMEWQKTRFPGCEIKMLMFDKESGLMTVLCRFEPGAVLPEHEHVGIEQTYVLDGTLADEHGAAANIIAKTGDFVWRKPGSRHSAWSPDGGIMLAVFQVPNKFFEKDGRITDMAGRLWDETWGHTGRVD
jgi:anti-sigma factor ChrR (cupin superfamily)